MVKIVESFVEIYPLNSIENIKKHIERCGRTCYKSEDKITDTSAEQFVEGILKSGHESVIEHANLIFKTGSENLEKIKELASKVKGLNYLQFATELLVSGNMRTFRDISRLGYNDFDTWFRQNGLEVFANQDSSALCLVGELSLKGIQYLDKVSQDDDLNNITVHMITNLSCYKDITRHRLASFSIESTRFCNYSKGKYGSELTILKPVNLDEGTPEYAEWLACMQDTEKHYMKMCELGCRADQSRLCLPHSIKADVIMTANVKEWKHIFNLRCDKAAHPDVRKVMLSALELFYNEGYTTFNDLYAKFLPDIEEFRRK
ncbi:MAG: FAD-dependent thymidylate synthase [Alphaproteobacteria bacterium]|nr:FAD-dependent thymidylate synthase [Alphaproteobacteria bacterium]